MSVYNTVAQLLHGAVIVFIIAATVCVILMLLEALFSKCLVMEFN